MKQRITELISALGEKGALLQEMKELQQQGQSCLVTLDLEGLERNQREVAGAMERMERLTDACKALIAGVGSELGLAGNQTLSPIIEKLGQPESGALKNMQSRVAEQSQALHRCLALNRAILGDSLHVVEGSLKFFHRLFNPVDTYGNAGSLVSRRGGSRLVCKEI
jgi:hypothetical protein